MTWLSLLWRCSCLWTLDRAQHAGSLLIMVAGERGQIMPVREAKIAAEGRRGSAKRNKNSLFSRMTCLLSLQLFSVRLVRELRTKHALNWPILAVAHAAAGRFL
jgi:hypothetical protein